MMLPIKYCLDEQNLSGAPHGGVRARTKRNHGANHGGNIIDQAEVEWIDPLLLKTTVYPLKSKHDKIILLCNSGQFFTRKL